jgi:hypothetical protein
MNALRHCAAQTVTAIRPDARLMHCKHAPKAQCEIRVRISGGRAKTLTVPHRLVERAARMQGTAPQTFHWLLTAALGVQSSQRQIEPSPTVVVQTARVS